jgi:hypothetical protein
MHRPLVQRCFGRAHHEFDRASDASWMTDEAVRPLNRAQRRKFHMLLKTRALAALTSETAQTGYRDACMITDTH